MKLSFKAETFQKLYPQIFLEKFIRKDIRPDGRAFLTPRSIQGTKDCIQTSNGSCLIVLGNTRIICGIKSQVAVPTEEHPDRGFIVPNVDISPMSSHAAKPGPPSDYAQILSQHLSELDRIVDLKNLCIEEGKLVWCLYVDIVVINDDGSLLPAVLMGFVAAAKGLKLAHVEMNDDLVVETGGFRGIELKSIPVASSFGILQSVLLNDLTKQEEEQMESIWNICVDEDKNLLFCYGRGNCADSDMQTMIKEAFKRQVEFTEWLNK